MEQILNLFKLEAMKLQTTLLHLILFALTCCKLNAQQVTSNKISVFADTVLTPGKQALSLISLDSTGQAIQLLLSGRETEPLLLLKSRFNKSNKDFRLGIVDFETWDIEQNRINVALLELIPDRPAKTGKIAGSDIEQLVAKGNVETVLKQLVATGDELAIILQARYLRVSALRMQGTINADTFYKINARISSAILELYTD